MTTANPPATGYRAIAEQIVRQIALGELAPGARLPPVRQAAARWGVNLNTVQRAYAHLAAQGIVASRAGGGTRVAAAPVEPLRAVRDERLRLVLAEAIGTALGLGCSAAEIEAAFVGQLAQWGEARRAHGASPHSATDAAPTHLRFAGSHDLSLELLASHLRAAPDGLTVQLDMRGSLGGLFALASGTCDLAGCHLLDAESGEYNLPFVRRVLPDEPVALVTLAEREQGLLVAPDNPLALQGVADLARPGVRFVNRPRGSGTRVLLDRLLAVSGVPAARVDGYAREEPTHLAVAAAVAGGLADAGLGIRAAARAAGLGFVPLARERYELAYRAEAAHLPGIERLLATLQGAAFRAAVTALGGYDTRDTGQLRRVG